MFDNGVIYCSFKDKQAQRDSTFLLTEMKALLSGELLDDYKLFRKNLEEKNDDLN